LTNQTANADRLWERFKTKQDQQARQALIELYAPLVKYVAGRLAMHMPSNVELEDLESYGAFGLLDAVDKFDPERDVKFETYATTRIRGAILDGLRAADWVPRSTRAKAKALESTIRELTNMLGRMPTDDEVAAALEMPKERYYQILDEVRGTVLYSLDDLVGGESPDEAVRISELVVHDDLPIDHNLIQAESLAELTAAIEQLSDRERLVLSLYYKDDLTLKEIGHVLGVTESRVSQIHTKAILNLRAKLKWF
jgi:RNA polymerase sigma factor for flagellar operon FliA